MELQEFLDVMKRKERVVKESETHRFMHTTAFETMKLTAD